MKKIVISLFSGLMLILTSQVLNAQRVLLDKYVQAGGLNLFPEVENESNYYYLADKPRLALHPDGKPQFSFIRYVKNEASTSSSNNAIIESTTGGGIIHGLVELSVSPEQIRAAERELRRLDGDGKIVGAIVPKSGTVALVSTQALPNGENTQKIVGLGAAPILENQRSAVAVQLNKLGSKLLWESFNTPTPDFSFNFEMEVEGYLSPKRVLIEADFERIYKHQSIEAAVVTPVLAAEIQAAFDELYDQGAIKVTQKGSDEQLDRLRETAYNQLITLMFDKIGGTGIPQINELMPNNQKNMLDRATEMLNKAREDVKKENDHIDEIREKRAQQESKVRNGAQNRAKAVMAANGGELKPPQGSQKKVNPYEEEAEAGINPSASEDLPKKQPLPSLAVAVSYQLKKQKRTGKYTIDLNKYTETTRSFPFAYNPGNVKSVCASCFLEVNLDDPLMRQREVIASVSGINATDFNYISNINVLVKKDHQNGKQTLQEVVIEKSDFDKTGNLFKMLYGYQGDSDRDEWLKYDYRTKWSYANGYVAESPWQKTEFASISLSPEVIQKPVYVEVDEDFVADVELRAVEINFYTKMGAFTEKQTLSLKTNKDELSKTVNLLLPKSSDEYEYEIIYSARGRDALKSSKRKSNYGRIDIDAFLK